jgi:chorismate mutase
MKGVSWMIYCRGIRGATTVESNTREEILLATKELLLLMIERNGLRSDDVVSAIFTVTNDLDAVHPALAARSTDIGWLDIALMCACEIPVPGSLSKCIRVLLHVNTERSNSEIQHVYIRGAASLRPTFAIEI